jgi:hypothetical protein
MERSEVDGREACERHAALLDARAYAHPRRAKDGDGLEAGTSQTVPAKRREPRVGDRA